MLVQSTRLSPKGWPWSSALRLHACAKHKIVSRRETMLLKFLMLTTKHKIIVTRRVTVKRFAVNIKNFKSMRFEHTCEESKITLLRSYYPLQRKSASKCHRPTRNTCPFLFEFYCFKDSNKNVKEQLKRVLLFEFEFLLKWFPKKDTKQNVLSRF